MDPLQIYQDIKNRTDGEIYIGVVGPVRTGKSTFIRRFMEILALPGIEEKQLSEVRDQLPVSGSGTLITTVEPKFIPKEACRVKLAEGLEGKLRLIDSVGYMVDHAAGNVDGGKERMVKTPWFDQEIPFHQAAETGTQKVIRDHSTIGLVITCDGSFGEIPRESFVEAEGRTIRELQQLNKPFLVLLNSQRPHAEETQKLAASLAEKYNVETMSVNCEQLKKEDVTHILEKVLYEFPIGKVEFYIPKWVELLPADHEVKAALIDEIRELLKGMHRIRDVSKEKLQLQAEAVQEVLVDEIDLSTGIVRVRIRMDERYYYEMISEMTGVPVDGEYQLISTLKDLAKMREEYVKVQQALEAVRGCGYGVVTPDIGEISIEEPALIKQGSRYGVRIKSKSPSIHMIKANIETEIAPIVGSEEQAKDLISYIESNGKEENGIWDTLIFGKSVEQLIQDGIHAKIAQISEESQVKLQDTMQKIVNDSKGGMVCIII